MGFIIQKWRSHKLHFPGSIKLVKYNDVGKCLDIFKPFFIFREQLSLPSGKVITFLDTLYFSLENVVPAGIVSEMVAIGPMARILAGLESLFGVVAVALFAAYVFRWSLHR